MAYVGPWSLRVHHKRGGWRAHVRRGSSRLCDLPAPVATRADAEHDLLEIAERLCARMRMALDARDLTAIHAALDALRGEVESLPQSEPASNHPRDAAAGTTTGGA